MDIITIIQQTATWIEKVNTDFETNLYRSPGLFYDQHYYHIPESGKAFVLNDIISKRAQMLADANVELIPVEELVNYGRIILCGTEYSTSDGIAEVESNCYFDNKEEIPHDTWICTGSQLNTMGFYKQDIDKVLLIGWVPQSQYFFANQAILTAILGNIEWAANDQIDERYFALKSIFSAPETISEPGVPINLEKRRQLMKAFDKIRDINSAPGKIIQTQPPYKPFWQRLAVKLFKYTRI